jgi:hypothetical protein
MAKLSIALAMENKVLCVLAFIVASALLAAQATAATKATVTYRIQRAWFDTEHVYVVFSKDMAKERYSIGDVNGTIVDDKKTIWIGSFPRSVVTDGIVLDLKADEPGNSIVFRDSDFTITKWGPQTNLSGRQIIKASPICGTPQDTGWPIRWRDAIFYCGSLYSLSGHQEWVLPATVLQAIGADGRSLSRPAVEHLGQHVPVFCMEADGQLIFTSSMGMSATLRLGSWTADQNGINWRTVPVGPQGVKALVANGVVAYSPNRIVLKAKSDQAPYWAQCHESKCDAIENISADDSYLLLDELARVAIALSIPNLTRPALHVQLAKF